MIQKQSLLGKNKSLLIVIFTSVVLLALAYILTFIIIPSLRIEYNIPENISVLNSSDISDTQSLIVWTDTNDISYLSYDFIDNEFVNVYKSPTERAESISTDINQNAGLRDYVQFVKTDSQSNYYIFKTVDFVEFGTSQECLWSGQIQIWQNEKLLCDDDIYSFEVLDSNLIYTNNSEVIAYDLNSSDSKVLIEFDTFGLNSDIPKTPSLFILDDNTISIHSPSSDYSESYLLDVYNYSTSSKILNQDISIIDFSI